MLLFIICLFPTFLQYILYSGNLTAENDKIGKNLKRMVKKHILKDAEAELAVADAKLGKLLKVSSCLLMMLG